MDIIQRLQICLRRRKSDGALVFPRSVRAHYNEIMHYLPDALTEDEKIYLLKPRLLEDITECDIF